MAALLAASLRRHAPRGAQLVAAVPQPAEVWGELAPETLTALGRLRVRIEPIAVPFGPERSHANKIGALRVTVAADRLVLVDTDMLALATFRDQRPFDAAVAAKPADLQAWTHDVEIWRATFAAGGVRLPESRVLTTVSGEETPPYFNSGMLVVQRPAELADQWERCANALWDTDLPSGVWSDQPALAVALRATGTTVATLGDELNFPVHMRPLPRDQPPALAHYHRPSVVEIEPRLRACVHDLMARHPPLARLLRSRPEWNGVVAAAPPARRRRRHASPRRDILITGISGSGTSGLCRLLRRYPDCVVVMDPPEVSAALDTQRVPWAIPAYMQRTRLAVAGCEEVATGVVGGRPPIDPLAVRPANSPGAAAPDRNAARAANPDHVLAIESVPALARLEAVRPLIPDARIVLCARDPYGAIASWKRTLAQPGERGGDALGLPRHDHPLLPARDREELAAIAACSDDAERRARWWAWSARRLLEHRDGAVLVDHEELVRDPRPCLARVMPGLAPGAPPAGPGPPAAPPQRHVLDDRDREVIGGLCLPLARELGIAVRTDP